MAKAKRKGPKRERYKSPKLGARDSYFRVKGPIGVRADTSGKRGGKTAPSGASGNSD